MASAESERKRPPPPIEVKLADSDFKDVNIDDDSKTRVQSRASSAPSTPLAQNKQKTPKRDESINNVDDVDDVKKSDSVTEQLKLGTVAAALGGLYLASRALSTKGTFCEFDSPKTDVKKMSDFLTGRVPSNGTNDGYYQVIVNMWKDMQKTADLDRMNDIDEQMNYYMISVRDMEFKQQILRTWEEVKRLINSLSMAYTQAEPVKFTNKDLLVDLNTYLSSGARPQRMVNICEAWRKKAEEDSLASNLRRKWALYGLETNIRNIISNVLTVMNNVNPVHIRLYEQACQARLLPTPECGSLAELRQAAEAKLDTSLESAEFKQRLSIISGKTMLDKAESFRANAARLVRNAIAVDSVRDAGTYVKDLTSSAQQLSKLFKRTMDHNIADFNSLCASFDRTIAEFLDMSRKEAVEVFAKQNDLLTNAVPRMETSTEDMLNRGSNVTNKDLKAFFEKQGAEVNDSIAKLRDLHQRTNKLILGSNPGIFYDSDDALKIRIQRVEEKADTADLKSLIEDMRSVRMLQGEFLNVLQTSAKVPYDALKERFDETVGAAAPDVKDLVDTLDASRIKVLRPLTDEIVKARDVLEPFEKNLKGIGLQSIVESNVTPLVRRTQQSLKRAEAMVDEVNAIGHQQPGRQRVQLGAMEFFVDRLNPDGVTNVPYVKSTLTDEIVALQPRVETAASDLRAETAKLADVVRESTAALYEEFKKVVPETIKSLKALQVDLTTKRTELAQHLQTIGETCKADVFSQAVNACSQRLEDLKALADRINADLTNVRTIRTSVKTTSQTPGAVEKAMQDLRMIVRDRKAESTDLVRSLNQSVADILTIQKDKCRESVPLHVRIWDSIFADHAERMVMNELVQKDVWLLGEQAKIDAARKDVMWKNIAKLVGAVGFIGGVAYWAKQQQKAAKGTSAEALYEPHLQKLVLRGVEPRDDRVPRSYSTGVYQHATDVIRAALNIEGPIALRKKQTDRVYVIDLPVPKILAKDVYKMVLTALVNARMVPKAIADFALDKYKKNPTSLLDVPIAPVDAIPVKQFTQVKSQLKQKVAKTPKTRRVRSKARPKKVRSSKNKK